MRFSSILIDWYEQDHRSLPWRDTRDPYKIWLSEIILQQTRVDQGLPYYLKFVAAYPTVQDLARATQDEVLKLWQGLGYYSRARNLQKAAQQVTEHHDGVFPADYKALIELAGVGPYTAAAIASFAFQLPHAVVDGNVYRVLSRYFDVDLPINKPKGQKHFAALAQEVLDTSRPDLHNQAIMEFGARQCTPKNPDCMFCPLNESCASHAVGRVQERPVKEGKTAVKKVWMDYLFVESPEGIAVRKRADKGIWSGLYDFPLIEGEKETSRREAQSSEAWRSILDPEAKVLSVTEGIVHRLSHRLLHVRFWRVKSARKPDFPGIVLVDREELPNFAVPVVIHEWMKTQGLA